MSEERHWQESPHGWARLVESPGETICLPALFLSEYRHVEEPGGSSANWYGHFRDSRRRFETPTDPAIPVYTPMQQAGEIRSTRSTSLHDREYVQDVEASLEQESALIASFRADLGDANDATGAFTLYEHDLPADSPLLVDSAFTQFERWEDEPFLHRALRRIGISPDQGLGYVVAFYVDRMRRSIEYRKRRRVDEAIYADLEHELLLAKQQEGVTNVKAVSVQEKSPEEVSTSDTTK